MKRSLGQTTMEFRRVDLHPVVKNARRLVIRALCNLSSDPSSSYSTTVRIERRILLGLPWVIYERSAAQEEALSLFKEKILDYTEFTASHHVVYSRELVAVQRLYRPLRHRHQIRDLLIRREGDKHEFLVEEAQPEQSSLTVLTRLQGLSLQQAMACFSEAITAMRADAYRPFQLHEKFFRLPEPLASSLGDSPESQLRAAVMRQNAIEVVEQLPAALHAPA